MRTKNKISLTAGSIMVGSVMLGILYLSCLEANIPFGVFLLGLFIMLCGIFILGTGIWFIIRAFM